jgi:hypothetical protein
MLLVTWMKSRICSSSTLGVCFVIGSILAVSHTVIVIISLCRNPDGLLWAGDTAQTISIGSTFTFKQLGASVYRYQVCQFTITPNNVEQSSRDQFEPCAGRLVNPRVFSCSQTIAPMAVLSNVQTPSSSCCSDFRVQSTSYDQRQGSLERNCPKFSTARVFLKVASSFF